MPSDTPDDQHSLDKAVALFEVPVDGLTAKRGRNKNMFKSVEYEATVDWLLLLDYYIYMMKGKGLDFAKNLHVLDALGATLGTRYGNTDVDVLKRVAQLKVPETIDATADEEQLQITGANAAEQVLGITFTRRPDLFHRLHNNMKKAVCQAQRWPTYVQACACITGLNGPNNTNLWYNEVMQEAFDAPKTFRADSPTVLRFWPGVLLDHGLQHSDDDDDEVGLPAREKFVANHPTFFC